MVNLVVNVLFPPIELFLFCFFLPFLFCFYFICCFLPSEHIGFQFSLYLVFILLLVYSHTYTFRTFSFCLFSVFNFFDLVVHTLWIRCTLFVQSFLFPLEWVMLKVFSLCFDMVIVWDIFNRFNGSQLWSFWAWVLTPPSVTRSRGELLCSGLSVGWWLARPLVVIQPDCTP